MKVDLIHFTGKGTNDEGWYAARLLAFTKGTRLQMSPEGLDKFKSMTMLELQKELAYMASTIASSWEFVDVVFAINDVSRACAQQITRTRNASFAMQSQRVTDMSDVTCHIPPTVPVKCRTRYELTLSASLASYEQLVKDGCSLEDARGVLPMNTHCNLIAKYNLRSWVDLARARDSIRVQGEYRAVIAAMKAAVLKVWPWAATFIEPKQIKSIALIEQVANQLPPGDLRTNLAKSADLLKKDTA
jgi:flavin-dependent thymidylate synthase